MDDACTNGNISFWYADIGGRPAPRAPLDGDISADVCIVGAGYTGLWTAYYLKRAEPSLRIVVVEKEFAGFGASGRNGGWLSGSFAWNRERYLNGFSRSDVVAMESEMRSSVDEVISVSESEGIDADIVRTQALRVACTPAQLQRMEREIAEAEEWNQPDGRIRLLNAKQASDRIQISGVLGATLVNGMARVQPAKLVRGLALAVERLGVPVYEQTTVKNIQKCVVVTNRGTIRAPVIVRATEGFTATFPQYHRLWLPMNSAIAVTEPLPAAMWEEIGWKNCELLGDLSHASCYAQITREGRIAIGGRGVPYRFGSRTDDNGATQRQTIEQLRAILTRLLPQTARLKFDHAWCGVLGIPRDWCASVGYDRSTGLAWAGGYVGLGVSTSNVAGRTLADLILDKSTPLTRLPWVGRSVRKWEVEPLRWIGVRSMYKLFAIADRAEAKSGKRATSPLAKFANKLTGR